MNKEKISNAERCMTEAYPGKLLYNTKEAAQVLGLQVGTLQCYRNRGIGPKYVHVNGPHPLAMYPHDELVKWINQLKASKEVLYEYNNGD